MTRDEELEKATEEAYNDYYCGYGECNLTDSFKAGANWEQARSQKLVEALEKIVVKPDDGRDRRIEIKYHNPYKIASEALTQYKGGGE